MGTLIICLVLLGIVAFLVYIVWSGIQSIVLSWKLQKRQGEVEEKMERMGADAILYRHVKDGKIPSWAYDRATKELKAYCNRAKRLDYSLYMADQKLEVIPMNPAFQFEANTPIGEQKMVFATQIREFDLETYGRTGKPAARDQERMDEMAKVWYFVDPHCSAMEQAKLNLRILAKSFIPEEWRTAKPAYEDVLNEQKGGSRYKERT